jgi:hypothetical protein
VDDGRKVVTTSIRIPILKGDQNETSLGARRGEFNLNPRTTGDSEAGDICVDDG